MAAIAALPTTTLRRNNNNNTKGVSSRKGTRDQICLLTWPLSDPLRVDFITCLEWTRGTYTKHVYTSICIHMYMYNAHISYIHLPLSCVACNQGPLHAHPLHDRNGGR